MTRPGVGMYCIYQLYLHHSLVNVRSVIHERIVISRRVVEDDFGLPVKNRVLDHLKFLCQLVSLDLKWYCKPGKTGQLLQQNKTHLIGSYLFTHPCCREHAVFGLPCVWSVGHLGQVKV